MSPAPSKNATVDFDALEDAVRETSRGRWFLDEYARRLRNAESDRVHQSIEKLTSLFTEKNSTSNFDVLRRELEVMASGIAQTRREIAAIKPATADAPDAPGNDRIIAATEELDFVVRSTETATAEILTAAERLFTISAELKEKGGDVTLCDEIENHATNLMLACSFQDLTGQRMTKVVNALRYIEQRVNSMIEIWGINPADVKNAPPPQKDARPDAHLLNGPAREGEGVAQDEIDRMLNGTGEDAAETAAPAETASQNDIDALFQ
ncbi:MAG: protein phosphatase CheZ [Alphaproteobacteria bacterium]|nr:protein phosphatase CheZ [Alphaproteobacteria bacterium]